MCENVTSEVTVKLVKRHKNKSIDLLVCIVYSKQCLEAPEFGDCCTITTTPCWNDTHANIFHQPPCETNFVGPVCCPHVVSPLSVMFYLLPPICWEITQQARQFARLMLVLGNIWSYRSRLTLEAAYNSSAVIQKGLFVIGFCRSLP